MGVLPESLNSLHPLGDREMQAAFPILARLVLHPPHAEGGAVQAERIAVCRHAERCAKIWPQAMPTYPNNVN